MESPICPATSTLRRRWPRPPAGGAAPAIAQDVVKVRTRGFHRGHESKRHSGDHRHEYREGEHREIDADGLETGEVVAGVRLDQAHSTPQAASSGMPGRHRRRRRASSTLSASSWRTSCPRLAPSAARTAISLARPVARAIISPATLAQAISRTKPTAPVRINRVGRICSVILSCSGAMSRWDLGSASGARGCSARY